MWLNREVCQNGGDSHHLEKCYRQKIKKCQSSQFGHFQLHSVPEKKESMDLDHSVSMDKADPVGREVNEGMLAHASDTMPKIWLTNSHEIPHYRFSHRANALLLSNHVSQFLWQPQPWNREEASCFQKASLELKFNLSNLSLWELRACYKVVRACRQRTRHGLKAY